MRPIVTRSMLASAALLWITFHMDAETPRMAIGRGWTLGAAADTSWQPLFAFPDYQSGLEVSGAFRIAHAIRRDTMFAFVGRGGATYADDWRRLFEGGVEVTWRNAVELRSGLRHDDRLSREGALVSFRDPTGRIFLGATAYLIRKGAFAAGAAIDYERARCLGVDRVCHQASV